MEYITHASVSSPAPAPFRLLRARDVILKESRHRIRDGMCTAIQRMGTAESDFAHGTRSITDQAVWLHSHLAMVLQPCSSRTFSLLALVASCCPNTLFYYIKLQPIRVNSVFDDPLISPSNGQSLSVITMHASIVALLVLAASAATGALAAPLPARDATDVQVSPNTDLTYPQMMGGHAAARSEDGGAALNELVRDGQPDHEIHGNHHA
ncbi:hypothetical protein DFH94DRAFT_755808, partial [Russula ochroleuca]